MTVLSRQFIRQTHSRLQPLSELVDSADRLAQFAGRSKGHRARARPAYSAVAIILANAFSAVAFLAWPSHLIRLRNARNIAECGLSFERVADLDWETAVVIEDNRPDYGERRLRVMARLDGRLYARW